MDKTITIIIPTYNTDSFITKCFNSIIVNDFYFVNKYKIHVLFINDGSTDDSQKVIDVLKEKYNFVSSIYQQNQGLSVARNTAIKHIQTDYFLLLDSDDWLNMDEFEKVYDLFLNQNIDFISFGLTYYDECNNYTGHRQNQSVHYNTIYSGIEFLMQGYQPSSACLFIYDRKFILKNKLFYYPHITQQDVEHTFRLMLYSEKGVFVENKVYNYYRRLGSTTIPNSPKKLKKYLSDSIIVAAQISKNKQQYSSKVITKLIEENYNSVVWNLLWRFISKPKEVDYEFKKKCLKELKDNNLYPIKGGVKTTFQKLTTLFFNQTFIIKCIFKLIK